MGVNNINHSYNPAAQEAFEAYCSDFQNWHKARLKQYKAFICVPDEGDTTGTYVFDGKTGVLAFTQDDVELLPIDRLKNSYKDSTGKIIEIESPMEWKEVRFVGEEYSDVEALQLDKRYWGLWVETPAGNITACEWLLRRKVNGRMVYAKYSNKQFQVRYDMTPFKNTDKLTIPPWHPCIHVGSKATNKHLADTKKYFTDFQLPKKDRYLFKSNPELGVQLDYCKHYLSNVLNALHQDGGIPFVITENDTMIRIGGMALQSDSNSINAYGTTGGMGYAKPVVELTFRHRKGSLGEINCKLGDEGRDYVISDRLKGDLEVLTEEIVRHCYLEQKQRDAWLKERGQDKDKHKNIYTVTGKM